MNNDALLDLYYVAGQMDNEPCFNMENQTNAVFLNNGDRGFSDVSVSCGADDPGTGRGVAHGDFDNDGRIDMFVVNLWRSDGTSGTASLFRNAASNANHWLSVRTIGTTSNLDGFGARITVTAGGVTQIREMRASQAHMSHSVVPVHFCLGEATRADTVEIRWPSGMIQVLTDVDAAQILTATEP